MSSNRASSSVPSKSIVDSKSFEEPAAIPQKMNGCKIKMLHKLVRNTTRVHSFSVSEPDLWVYVVTDTILLTKISTWRYHVPDNLQCTSKVSKSCNRHIASANFLQEHEFTLRQEQSHICISPLTILDHWELLNVCYYERCGEINIVTCLVSYSTKFSLFTPGLKYNVSCNNLYTFNILNN